jgi:hypothetical protein
VVHPGIQIKPIEGDALFADADFNQIRTDFRIEAVPVHPDIEGGIAETDQARDKAGEIVGRLAHVWRRKTVARGEGSSDRARSF